MQLDAGGKIQRLRVSRKMLKRRCRGPLQKRPVGAGSKPASDSVVISSELDSFQSLVKPSVERLYGLLPGAGVLYAREKGIG